MSLIKKIKWTIISSCFILLFTIFLIVINVLKNNAYFAEFWTINVARPINNIVGHISSFIPFSLTEFFFINLFLLIIMFLVFFIVYLKKKKVISATNQLLNIAFTILLTISCYTFSCGLAYNRLPLPIVLNNEGNKEEYLDVINYYTDDLNSCTSQLSFKSSGDVISPYSFKQINKLVQDAYHILDGNNYYASFTSSSKKMLSSFIYREFQITGVTFSPFNEANINTLNVTCDIPFTIAHELAHTKGVMREEDANFLATYVLLKSDNYYLRYSAYMRTYYQILSVASYTDNKDDYAIIYQSIAENFLKNQSYNKQYWKDHDALEKISTFFNNLYLKVSGEKEGVASYEGGTYYHYDEEEKKLIPSKYQKLYFSIYYGEL